MGNDIIEKNHGSQCSLIPFIRHNCLFLAMFTDVTNVKRDVYAAFTLTVNSNFLDQINETLTIRKVPENNETHSSVREKVWKRG